MNRMLIVWCVAFLLLPTLPTAQEKMLPDAVQEQRAQALFTQLRCTVCEGQPLAGSAAELAVQMRGRIREMVAAGDSDQKILDYFAARYGQDILMRPPQEGVALGLWMAPLLFVGLGAFILYLCLSRQKKG